MTPNFAQLFEECLKEIETRPGSIIKGTVIAICKDNVTIDAGLRSHSTISIDQFKNSSGEIEVIVGDEINVALDATDDGFGETILSREKAKRHESWQVLTNAYEEGKSVVGVINGKVKGGYTVEILNIRAFLPISLLDTRAIQNTSHLEGKDLEFRVIKLDQKRNNVVVSRRAVLESLNTANRVSLFESLHEGKEVKGTVKNITDFGAFVDLGGIDGLLHISEMTDDKAVKHPNEVLKTGQELTLNVIKLDKNSNKISLSLHKLEFYRWKNLVYGLEIGQKVLGTVSNNDNDQVIITLPNGICGKINFLEKGSVKLHDKLTVYISNINDTKRTIEFSIKPNDEFSFADISKMV